MDRPKGSLISYFSNKVKKYGGINLAQGICGFPPPKQLVLVLQELINKKQINHQYAPGNGDFKLLELLAGFYSGCGLENPDDILIVQGATEGISLVFLYLKSIITGDFSILSFDPPYESYPQIAGIYQVPFEYFDYNKDLSVDFKKLERVIKKKRVKIIILSSPGNPLGKIWTKEELEKLNSLALRNRLYLMFDGVYEDIYFAVPPFNPLQLGNKNLFYINSFSKMLSVTGWRIGYIIAQKEHMEKLKRIHDYTGLCANTLFQEVLAGYLARYGFGGKYTAALREKCKASFVYLKQSLLKLNFELPSITGGYFLWVKLPSGFGCGFEFASELYDQEKVAVTPGENFSPNKKNYIRLNFALEIKTVKQAAAGINNWFNKNSG